MYLRDKSENFNKNKSNYPNIESIPKESSLMGLQLRLKLWKSLFQSV